VVDLTEEDKDTPDAVMGTNPTAAVKLEENARLYLVSTQDQSATFSRQNRSNDNPDSAANGAILGQNLESTADAALRQDEIETASPDRIQATLQSPLPEVTVSAMTKEARPDDSPARNQDGNPALPVECLSETDNVGSDTNIGSGRDTSTDTNSAEELPALVSSPTNTAKDSGAPKLTPEVKKEETKRDVKKKRLNVYAKYKDRYLLQRHSPEGIGRLGGGHQETYPKPSQWGDKIWKDKRLIRDYPFPKSLSEADLEDYEELDMDTFQYTCYNGEWNINAPKYAGQPFAAVTGMPSHYQQSGHAFPVFVRRARGKSKLLGWEYVGNYKAVSIEEDSDFFWESAQNYSLGSKSLIAGKVLKSSKAENGYGRHMLDRWKEILKDELEKDDSPAAPVYLAENREPTAVEKYEKLPPLAARARALGFHCEISDEELVNVLVRLDEFHSQRAIQFVEHDERIYEWCKGGRTNHDAEGKPVCKTKKEPAKAGDWYNWAEQNMLM